MEYLEKINSRLMAEKIRERTTRSKIIEDKDGNILTERGEVIKRREEYVREFYSNARGEKPDFGEVEQGPSILKSEVEKAVGE